MLSHTFTGYGVEKRSLRLMQWGTGIFVVAGPIDVINHRINGLDLTSWSPSHLLLYFGTFIMIIGVIRNWYRTYPSDGKFRWQWTAGLTALFAFLFEDAFFPQLQQEYGILEVASWFRGAPYAEPSLLSFAANQIGRPVDDAAVHHFAMPIPAWVYPVWGIAVCVAILVFARLMVGFRWTATCVVGGYLVYRLLIWPLLVVCTFPPSSPPLWLLPVGLAVDLMFLLRMNEYVRGAIGAVVVTAVAFGALLLHALALGSPLTLADDDVTALRAAWAAGHGLHTPPIAWWSWWIAGLGLLAGLGCCGVPGLEDGRAGHEPTAGDQRAVRPGAAPLRQGRLCWAGTNRRPTRPHRPSRRTHPSTDAEPCSAGSFSAVLSHAMATRTRGRRGSEGRDRGAGQHDRDAEGQREHQQFHAAPDRDRGAAAGGDPRQQPEPHHRRARRDDRHAHQLGQQQHPVAGGEQVPRQRGDRRE